MVTVGAKTKQSNGGVEEGDANEMNRRRRLLNLQQQMMELGLSDDALEVPPKESTRHLDAGPQVSPRRGRDRHVAPLAPQSQSQQRRRNRSSPPPPTTERRRTFQPGQSVRHAEPGVRKQQSQFLSSKNTASPPLVKKDAPPSPPPPPPLPGTDTSPTTAESSPPSNSYLTWSSSDDEADENQQGDNDAVGQGGDSSSNNNSNSNSSSMMGRRQSSAMLLQQRLSGVSSRMAGSGGGGGSGANNTGGTHSQGPAFSKRKKQTSTGASFKPKTTTTTQSSASKKAVLLKGTKSNPIPAATFLASRKPSSQEHTPSPIPSHTTKTTSSTSSPGGYNSTARRLFPSTATGREAAPGLFRVSSLDSSPTRPASSGTGSIRRRMGNNSNANITGVVGVHSDDLALELPPPSPLRRRASHDSSSTSNSHRNLFPRPSNQHHQADGEESVNGQTVDSEDTVKASNHTPGTKRSRKGPVPRLLAPMSELTATPYGDSNASLSITTMDPSGTTSGSSHSTPRKERSGLRKTLQRVLRRRGGGSQHQQGGSESELTATSTSTTSTTTTDLGTKLQQYQARGSAAAGRAGRGKNATDDDVTTAAINGDVVMGVNLGPNDDYDDDEEDDDEEEVEAGEERKENVDEEEKVPKSPAKVPLAYYPSPTDPTLPDLMPLPSLHHQNQRQSSTPPPTTFSSKMISSSGKPGSLPARSKSSGEAQRPSNLKRRFLFPRRTPGAASNASSNSPKKTLIGRRVLRTNAIAETDSDSEDYNDDDGNCTDDNDEEGEEDAAFRDDAIRGRLDGIDAISISSSSTMVSVQQMVAETLRLSGGKEPAEIVFEGFLPHGEDRWIVRLDAIAQAEIVLAGSRSIPRRQHRPAPPPPPPPRVRTSASRDEDNNTISSLREEGSLTGTTTSGSSSSSSSSASEGAKGNEQVAADAKSNDATASSSLDAIGEISPRRCGISLPCAPFTPETVKRPRGGDDASLQTIPFRSFSTEEQTTVRRSSGTPDDEDPENDDGSEVVGTVSSDPVPGAAEDGTSKMAAESFPSAAPGPGPVELLMGQMWGRGNRPPPTHAVGPWNGHPTENGNDDANTTDGDNNGNEGGVGTTGTSSPFSRPRTPAPPQNAEEAVLASVSCPVDVDEDIFIIDDASHLLAVHDIASAPLRAGRLYESMEVFQKILRSLAERYGRRGPHHLVGAALHNLGLLQMWAGQYEAAAVHLRKGLDIRAVTMHRNHPAVVATLSRLGMAYFALDRMPEALDCWERAIRAREAPDNDAATVVSAPVTSSTKQQRRQSHHQHHQQQQKQRGGRRRRRRRGHLELGKIHNNMGVVYFQKNNFVEALRHFTFALEIQRKWLEDPIRRESLVFDVSVTLGNMGKVYLRQCDYELSFHVYEEALLLQTTIYRKDSNVVLTTLTNLAHAKAKNGDRIIALRMYESVLRTQKNKFEPLGDGKWRKWVMDTTKSIAALQWEEGRYGDALQGYTTLLNWYRQLDSMESTPTSIQQVQETKAIIQQLEEAIHREVAVWI